MTISLYLMAVAILVTLAANGENIRPNVVLFLVDDWGFNDVGYHGNTDTQTPFIDSLAQNDGLIIEKFYANHLCSITRCALLTGRYPMRYGMQDFVLTYESNFALSLQETLLSQEFKAQGYSTHIVGKWHIGHLTWDYTPTYRGFDSFMGYYGGALYYNEHTGEDDFYDAYDLRMNTDPYNEDDIYSLYLWSRQAELIINEQASLQSNSIANGEEIEPFFLYFPWQGSHTPSEAVDTYLDIYSNGKSESEIEENETRFVFQAQTTMTDRLFKSFVGNLKSKGLWDNTLLIFLSDNGGEAGCGDNAPLRGGKGTLWEGGIRVPAFISGGYLAEHLRGKTFDSYPVHVTDWYPTILAASGLDIVANEHKKLDGLNVWNLLNTATKPTIAASIGDDVIESQSESQSQPVAMNAGILSSYFDGNFEHLLEITEKRIMLINVNSIGCVNEMCGALIYGGRWKLLYSSNEAFTVNTPCFWARDFELTEDDRLVCNGIPSDVSIDECKCATEVCLFDLLNDPCEYYDVSSEYPLMTEKLYDILYEYSEEQVVPLAGSIGNTDPNLINPNIIREDWNNIDINGTTYGFWGPWHNETDWRQLGFEKYIKEHNDVNDEEEESYDYVNSGSITYMSDNNDINRGDLPGRDPNTRGKGSKNDISESQSLDGHGGSSEENSNDKYRNRNKRIENNSILIVVIIASLMVIFCFVYLFLYVYVYNKQSIYSFRFGLLSEEKSLLTDSNMEYPHNSMETPFMPQI